jgi:methylenetetrahydrofolate reductase (NADPH)
MRTAPEISFEVFPPKGGAAPDFCAKVADLAAAGATVNVTYGASGSGRARSEEAVERLCAAGLAGRITPHLTATGRPKASVLDLAHGWQAAGITRILALRGDAPPEGPGEFACAVELTEALSAIGDFDISVACYPEGHPKSPSPEAEMAHLKRKFAAGARRAVSQFFFDADLFLRYRDACAAAGIVQPIVPGILPIASLATVHRFAESCGATVPPWLDERFEGLEDDPETLAQVSIATAVALAERLIAEGVTHIHLYTLNRAHDALTIARALGVRPRPTGEPPTQAQGGAAIS